jgi:hypothetical protein
VDNDAAHQHWMETMAAQGTLIGLSDNPRQFREPPLVGIFRQAQREWERSQRGGDGMDYMTVKF